MWIDNRNMPIWFLNFVMGVGLALWFSVIGIWPLSILYWGTAGISLRFILAR